MVCASRMETGEWRVRLDSATTIWCADLNAALVVISYILNHDLEVEPPDASPEPEDG